MKTNKFFIGAFALLLAGLASCSDEEPIGEATVTPQAESEDGNQYMTVVLAMSAGDDKGRALPTDDDFEMGSGDECTFSPSDILFLFFDEAGNPFPLAAANVNGQTTSNAVVPVEVVEEHGPGELDDPDAEVLSKLRLVLGKAVGEGYVGRQPSQALCLININKRIDASVVTNQRLSEVLKQQATLPNLDEEDVRFMMSTSVYVDDKGVLQETTKLKDCFYPTPEEADKAPAVFFVERVVAKVRVEFQRPADTGIDFPVLLRTAGAKAVTTDPYTVNNKPTPLRVELVAWDLIKAAGRNYIFKRLNAEKLNTYFTDWNDPTRHRCYWTEPLNSVTDLTNTKYDILNPMTVDSQGNTIPNTDYVNNGEWLNPSALPIAETTEEEPASRKMVEYCLEHTIQPEVPEGSDFNPATYRASNATGIVVRGVVKMQQDTNGDGKIEGDEVNNWQPVTLIRWAGAYYTYEVFRQMVIDAYNGSLPTGGTKLTADKVRINRDGNTNYCNTKVVTGSGDVDMPNFSHIQVWRSGLTSYYLNIEHTPGSTGDKKLYGVVRNHIYHYVIDAVVGLGVPGNDPEIPQETESFLSAKIYCLAWRVVKNTVTLE